MFLLTTLCALFALLAVVPVYATTGVIVPLYQFPVTSANWAPLETALSTFPSLQFYVIINPNSGPGDADSQPDPAYQTNIQTLRTHSNALLVGYVLTGFGTRASADVLQDIQTYAGWDASYGVDGIFFDQTMAGFDAEYTSYSDAVRSTAWPGRATRYVCDHEPWENIGNSDYYALADRDTRDAAQTYAEFQQESPIPLPHPAQQSVIIHTFTGAGVSNQTLSSVVTSLKSSGFASTYITNLNISETDVYANFGSDFAEFVADVAA
ncbi:Spherulation-specific family 4 [Roridomyces roridus]|uniref:Spherulation-specific family 4 n=1 Tax=Roridomyces roridus TaxID=1738132 RepID=A0AAD7BPS6_9AGAR|nr:Spherulation-specific family 4 [Roridomyces roridus]